MQFIIQKNLINPTSLSEIKDALAFNNIPHQLVEVIPFAHEITSDSPIIGNEFIPYGSTVMTMITRDWVGNFFDPEKFRYELHAQNRSDMLNAEHILSIGDAIEFMDLQASDSEWFIRPSEDLKQFSGQVIKAGECAEWLKDAVSCTSSGSYGLNDGTMVVIASPKNIKAEWRHFIVGGKVVSSAMYQNNGQLVKFRESDPEVLREAQAIADVWLPTPCCVMDLALIGDTVKVIEFNTINSSGFYNHDVAKIFVELYNYCLQHQKSMV